ncbi:hypothetical protein F4780DRAFT_660389 [Xylariomycetidae sp. FL0641]|nr:hypothetical protein F4780DRAFT_660389 [Xylariomycetidae sp. FL0641]
MSDPATRGPNADAGSKDEAEERLAACYNCKKSKLKCVRANGSSICTRCIQRRLDCAAPVFHVGRHKGVKNKHSGLEKAVFQIEQALRRSTPGSDQIQNGEHAAELRYLLERSRELLSAENGIQNRTSGPSGAPRHDESGVSPQHTSTSFGTSPSQAGSRDQDGGGGASSSQKIDEEQLNLDDAENPLQLLARTSELLSSITPPVPNGRAASGQLLQSSFKAAASAPGAADLDRDGDLQNFFGRFQPRLDRGEDLDPIDLGLLTLAEAEALFSYFYDKLAHTRWGIDPIIHTVDFVRRRSAFLLTSIAAASALFSPGMEALHTRLARHRRTLANLVMTHRYKSVEVVLAFMVNVPWLPAGAHWADDETSTYMAMALGIALDLGLNKIIMPAAAESPFSRDAVATSDRISARRALAMDGLAEFEIDSVMGRRFLRRRERTWLSLFVLERGVCLARGRSYSLPMSPLIENCDQWHLCDLADRWDGSIVSVAVLRRDLAKLLTSVRGICDSYLNGVSESSVVDRLKNEITVFFDRWYQTWPLQIGDRERKPVTSPPLSIQISCESLINPAIELALPPYVEILASHTRLSLYSSVINHSTAPVGARHLFRSEGLSAALNVLRAAVQGEAQLRSMPNNTAIMISFAACFALRVSSALAADGGRPGSSSSTANLLAPSIRALIAETVDVLTRIGETPVQRRGLSCLFARQLRQILRLAAASRPAPPAHHHHHPPPPPPLEQQQPPPSMFTPTNMNTNSSNNNSNSMVGMPPMSNNNNNNNNNSSSNPAITSATHANANANANANDYMMFSTMSNEQLNEAIHNTDVGLDALWEDFQFQHAPDLDWMDWSTFAS